MGIFSRLLGGADRPAREDRSQLVADDPRFDDWEPVRDFEEIDAARSWRQHLEDAGIDAVITSDWPLDRFGRGDISVRVPPDRWSDAEEFLSNLELD